MSDHHIVLRVVSKMLIPIILVYGFYVQFHGDYGPGGGFQAGVILAVAVILYALIFGIGEALEAIPASFARILAGLGLLLYCGVGVWSLVNGGNYLDYNALLQEVDGGHHGQHLGIMLVELGVLFTVSGAMVTIFYGFAGRVAEIKDEDW